MSDPALVEIKALEKTFLRPGNQVEVLKRIDLIIQEGQSLAVIGASGVGKTTLLHLIGALDRPTSGQVYFRGDEIFAWDDDRLAEFRNQSIGFVFQLHHLLPEFSAVENVMMPGLVGGLSPAQARARAEELLDQVGLSPRLEHRIGEISGGEQQRVAMARALVMRPRLLLADEPTGNLDRQTGELIHQLLVKLNQELGLTTVVATHNMDLAEMMDRRVRLIDGQVVVQDPGARRQDETR